jgi:hypothetical protein
MGRDHIFDQDVVEALVLGSTKKNDQPIIFVVEFAAFDIMDDEVTQSDVALNLVLIASYEEAISVAARNIERVDLPVLRILQNHGLGIAPAGHDPGTRAFTPGRQSHKRFSAPGSVQRQSAGAGSTSPERRRFSGLKFVRREKIEPVPGMIEAAVSIAGLRAIDEQAMWRSLSGSDWAEQRGRGQNTLSFPSPSRAQEGSHPRSQDRHGCTENRIHYQHPCR